MSTPILLLTKRDHWSQHAGALAQALFPDTLLWEQGTVGDALPASTHAPKFAAILSFLSPWIVPAALLEKAPLALNFHPGSCDYPGTGCYNFALYEEAAQFGSVCHHMLPKVDSGVVVDETLFPVFAHDTVETLKLRTMIAMLEQFHRVLSLVAAGSALPVHTRSWQRAPFTRNGLNALCEITPQMDAAEQQRRIRATTYPGYPGPYLLKNGVKEFYPVPDRAAIS